MNWKDAIIAFLLAAMVVGLILSRHAVKVIETKRHHADSVATHWEREYIKTSQRSEARGDTIRKLRESSAQSGETADLAHHQGAVIRATIASLKTTRDSLNAYVKLDLQSQTEISSLRARVYTDSLQILKITEDRDDWKHTADSLRKANSTINKDAQGIANAASRKINLGVLTVPVEVVEIALAGGAGFIIGKATSDAKTPQK